MRWTPGNTSPNVEDRSGGTALKLGVGGSVVMLVLSLLFGRDLLPEDVAVGEQKPHQSSPEEDKLVKFATRIPAFMYLTERLGLLASFERRHATRSSM